MHAPLWMALALAIGAAVPSAAPPADPAAQAEAVVAQLAAGNVQPVFEAFTPEMQAALPLEPLRALWPQLVGQAGEYKAHGPASISSIAGLTVARVPLTFELTQLVAEIAYDGTGRIAGLHFLPPPPARAGWTSPDYADTSRFVETEVSTGAPGWPLSATLTLPVGPGPFPAVVFVHGSGPQDRDEVVGALRLFKDLAQGLATRGIASLRYEKRTLAHRERLAQDRQFLTVREEVIDDALAAVQTLRRDPHVRPQSVFVVGHSLGGLLIPRIAQADPQIAGLVALAAPARRFDEILREQTVYLLEKGHVPLEMRAKKLAELDAELARLKNVRKIDDDSAPILGAPPMYWKDLLSYQPTRVARKVSQPLLFLQGERDYQVTLQDLALWRRALGDRPSVEFRTYPGLNHLFVAGTGPSVPAEYETPGHAARQVVEDIAAWVLRPRKGRP